MEKPTWRRLLTQLANRFTSASAQKVQRDSSTKGQLYNSQDLVYSRAGESSSHTWMASSRLIMCSLERSRDPAWQSTIKFPCNAYQRRPALCGRCASSPPDVAGPRSEKKMLSAQIIVPRRKHGLRRLHPARVCTKDRKQTKMLDISICTDDTPAAAMTSARAKMVGHHTHH